MQSASGAKVPDYPSIIIGRWDAPLMAERSRALPRGLFISSAARSVARCGAVISMARGPIRLLAVVFGRLNHYIDYPEIIDVMWGDDITGGPDNPRSILSQYLHDISLVAPSLGLQIQRRHSFGLRAVLTDCSLAGDEQPCLTDGCCA